MRMRMRILDPSLNSKLPFQIWTGNDFHLCIVVQFLFDEAFSMQVQCKIG